MDARRTDCGATRCVDASTVSEAYEGKTNVLTLIVRVSGVSLH
jgi:hypothetical protein